jgi:hypothetical protein
VKKYNSRQWAMSAAGAAAFVAIAVLFVPAWYTVVTPEFMGHGGTKTFHGTDEPVPGAGAYKGVWILVLSALAAACAASSLSPYVKKDTVNLLLGASAALYAIAAILAVTDATRELPTGTLPGFSAQRGFGPWSAALMAGLGAFFAAYTIKTRREEGAPAAAGGGI